MRSRRTTSHIGPPTESLRTQFDAAQWATLKLSSPGSPDDLMALASSYDSSGRYGTEVAFSDNIGSHFAGGEWRADSTHNAIITVINAGERSAQARFTLRYDKGEKKYEMQRTLKPGEQMWLRPADLIQRQTPDRSGNPLPANLSNGTFEVQDLQHLSGSLLVSAISSDNTWGSHVQRQSALCCGIGNPRFSPSFFDIPPIDVWNPFLSVATDQCTSAEESIGDDMISFWATNPAIAQMTASGVKGLVVGTTTGNGESDPIWVGAGNNCILKQVTPTAPITVQKPQITSFDPNPIMIGSTNGTLTINGSGFGSSPTVALPAGLTSTGSASTDIKIVLTGVSVAFSAKIGSNNVTVTANGVPSAPASLGVNGPNQMVVQSDTIGQCIGVSYQCRFVAYTVKNYDGTLASNIPIAENISFSGYNCNQSNPGNATAHCDATYHTDGGGNFSDQWSMYTGFTPAGCGENVTDHWQWCGPTGNNPNPGITFGTLAGWSHTSSVDINGYINPPTKIPQGTVISP